MLPVNLGIKIRVWAIKINFDIWLPTDGGSVEHKTTKSPQHHGNKPQHNEISTAQWK